VKPYKSVSLEFLANQLNVSREDIRSLLSELILEEKVKGEIDQLNGFLELETGEMRGSKRHVAMTNWAQALASLHSQLMKKLPA
jgi:COP9 signalosome complex subunit 2